MADLRFRTFRIRILSRLCPPDLTDEDRAFVAGAYEKVDEEGLVEFLKKKGVSERGQRIMEILAEAKAISERINEYDRTLPVLPHVELSKAYTRLRALGDAVEEIEAEASRKAEAG